MRQLTDDERALVARALAAERRRLREFYEGTREERDELRRLARVLRALGAYSDGELRD